MQVYIVQLKYSTPDENDTELFVFDSFDKAYQKFQDLIANEMNPENSWIGELDWKDGQPPDDYEFLSNETYDENQCQYWYVTDNYDTERHTYIDLFIKRVL